MISNEFIIDIDLKLPKDEIFIFHEPTMDIPIVNMLFRIDGISSITIHSNKMHISKHASYEWPILKPLILATVSDYKNNLLIDSYTEKILTVIDDYINPGLQEKHMDIYVEYVYHEGKSIFIRLNGMAYLSEMETECSSCTTSSCNTCTVSETILSMQNMDNEAIINSNTTTSLSKSPEEDDDDYDDDYDDDDDDNDDDDDYDDEASVKQSKSEILTQIENIFQFALDDSSIRVYSTI